MPSVTEPETGLLPVGAAVKPSAAMPPQRTSLAGRYVTLEPLDAGLHAASLYALSHGPGTASLWTYLPEGPFADAGTFHAYVEAKARSADPLFYAIIDNASGHAVGHASFLRMDPKNRVIEVGFILYTPALQRKPGATEAMYLMAAYVFETLGYRRYEWKCNDLNAPSMRAALRFGFTFEGVFRQHMIVKGRNRDTAWFAILDHEWPMRKSAYQAWLSEANFAADGGQRQSLGHLMNLHRLPPNAAATPLRRAGVADRLALEALQARAYQRNAIVTGTVPMPLQWDYAEVFATCEVWLLDGAETLDAALVLSLGRDDLTIETVSVRPALQGTGLGGHLLAFATKRAHALERKTLRLVTNQKMVHNIAWYERQGFVVERLEPISDRTIVHMIKSV